MTRKRVVNHAGAAWLAAVAGAWLVAAACRTIEIRPSAGAPTVPVGAALGEAVKAPSIRVGILADVEGTSIGAPSGVAVRGRAPGETAVRLRTLPQATFRPGAAAGRLRLLETGDELELAAIAPTDPSELLHADASPYRGLLEVRPGEAGRLTVVNTVHLEDYLRGVVPNELSPLAFPRIEALKAQAVAARTYALAHRGDYSARGYDVCATPSCQVYRGVSSELPLTDQAVEETRGIVATWRGRPINAYYTSTCGGHTEDGGPIFDDPAPYLRGVACLSEASSRPPAGTTTAPLGERSGGPATARDVALLEAPGGIAEDAARLDGDGERPAAALLVHEGLLAPGPDHTLHPDDDWEVRLTPADVARAVARYGSVGEVRDIVPKRFGVSGRVVELGVQGSAGELDLKGLHVRWGLGLRENLFVVRRERGRRGEIERFVITGKGWGHGVGLCQVGAYGMAHAGSTFEEILKHYYSGIALVGPGSAVAGRP